MTEYISREEVLDKSEYTENFNLVVPVRLIKAIPTADVQPVRRGKWVEIAGYGGWSETIYQCSECKITEWVKSNFCPNCGARMDGDING